MSTHYKTMAAERPPSIIRSLWTLADWQRKGIESPPLIDFLNRQQEDPLEVCLADMWMADLSQAAQLAPIREQRTQALHKAAGRSDLTPSEALALLREVTGEINRGKKLLRQLEAGKRHAG